MTLVLLDHEYSRGRHSAAKHLDFFLTLSGEANTQICCGRTGTSRHEDTCLPCARMNNKTKSELHLASRAPIDWMRNTAAMKQQRDEEQSAGFDPKQKVRLLNEADYSTKPCRTTNRSQVPIIVEAQQHPQQVNLGRRAKTRPGHPTHDPLFTSDVYNDATADNVHQRRPAYDLRHTLCTALFHGLTYTTPIGASQER